jgi:hypothetical protein
MALCSTQSLTEISTRNFPWGRKRPASLPPSMSRMSENVGASTSHKPKGLHGLYRDNFTFTLPYLIMNNPVYIYLHVIYFELWSVISFQFPPCSYPGQHRYRRNLRVVLSYPSVLQCIVSSRRTLLSVRCFYLRT